MYRTVAAGPGTQSLPQTHISPSMRSTRWTIARASWVQWLFDTGQLFDFAFLTMRHLARTPGSHESNRASAFGYWLDVFF